MPSLQFVSYAQNAEDVVLWRALGDVTGGTYVDVGAAHPRELSVTRALYERGWHGVDVEPVEQFVRLLEQDRPRDRVVQALMGREAGSAVLHRIAGTGLSTVVDAVAAGHARDGYPVEDVELPVRTLDELLDSELPGREIHLLKVDVEGAEADVLAGLDLRRRRPWVLVVEATAPLSTASTHEQWEPGLLAAGYLPCLFDGVSRFYVAQEHAELAPALSVPANALDLWISAEASRAQELEQEALEWRAEAVRQAAKLSRTRQLDDQLAVVAERWRVAVSDYDEAAWERGLLREEVEWLRGVAEQLRLRVAELEGSTSWRATAPLRRAASVRARLGGPSSS